MSKNIDVRVENHGTIFLFRLESEAAQEWVEMYVPEPLWLGSALACEHGFARDLADGMMSDGLVLE